MQIASITFDGEKKKSANYIIPATFFISASPKKPELKKTPIQSAPPPAQKVALKTPVQEAPKAPKPKMQNVQRRRSAFSLKNVHEKKESKKKVLEENFDNHPKDSFTQQALEETWQDYCQKLQKKGERSIAAILAADTPSLKENFVIEFTLPNKLMQDQLKQGRPKLMKHLRESLNNYGISLEVILNETVEKKFAYTPQEKYNKLKEKNPMIEKLKDSFQLDL
jgi:DNA polymerase-3 subunit gamma/tau